MNSEDPETENQFIVKECLLSSNIMMLKGMSNMDVQLTVYFIFTDILLMRMELYFSGVMW